MPAACTCGAGCAVGACAAAASCSCGVGGGFGFIPVIGYGRGLGYSEFTPHELTPEEKAKEEFWLKKHNEHVQEHAKKLAAKHFSYKGWAVTPYVVDPSGYAEMKWKATKPSDRTFEGATYAQVKLGILRYTDFDKWLDFLKKHI